MSVSFTLTCNSIDISFVPADKVPTAHHIATIPTSTSITGNTGSEESLIRASDWIHDCLSNHKILCSSFGLHNPLPTRVLDLGPYTGVAGEDDGNRRNDIRLLQTRSEEGRYICLSHCWGTGPVPLRTTRSPDTFTQYQQSIEFAALPRTFQEVVLFTRRLFIQYLWIDSLCIIQDDEEDWREQSALMAKVYSNALLTVAASGSAGPSVGLFHQEEAKDRYMDWEVSDDRSTDRKQEEFSEVGDYMRGIRVRRPLPHDANQHPLMTRAWVFQERLLSPRVLHFGTHELIWECMEVTSCECRGLEIGRSDRHNNWLGPKNRISDLSLTVLHQKGAMNAWQSAVSDYSRLKLSFPQDMFPAISGVARRISQATSQQYVAGLWRGWLIFDLIWRTEKPRAMERPKQWRAPTFSWASVTAKKDSPGGLGVSYDFMRTLESGIGVDLKPTQTDPVTGWKTGVYAEVIATQCNLLSTDDELGQITEAFIILSGTLIKVTLLAASDTSSRLRTLNLAPVGKVALEISFFWPDYDYAAEGQYHIAPQSELFCLKLASTQNMRGGDPYTLYLVLRKIGEQMEMSGLFERVGIYRDSRGSDTNLLMESERDAVQEGAIVKIV
jgi:hypothetical protein